MIADIFSVFDDQNGLIFSLLFLVWAISRRVLFLLFAKTWRRFSRWEMALFQPMEVVYRLITRTKGTRLGGFFLILSSLFPIIIIFNLLGLLPYVFRVTRHLVFRLSFALPLWLSLLIRRIRWNYYTFIAHFLPRGAPRALNPFLVLVEAIRVGVRPITLSIRLTANIGAGHIILTLVGRFLTTLLILKRIFPIILLYLVNSFYFIFEIAICYIQGYIFSLLLILYSDEHS